MEGKYLITTDQWFVAPDGQSYKAAWGAVSILEDNFLGIKTNRISTNWYAKVGGGEKNVIIAGCQIHYAVKCNNKPKLHKHNIDETFEGKAVIIEQSTRIYLAE